MKIYIILIFAALSLLSCNWKLLFNPAEVQSVLLTGVDGVPTATLSQGDARAIAEYISHAVYDTTLNETALRMTAPDYTLVIAYKTAANPGDWAQIWIASGRMSFRSKWYTLREKELPQAAAILKKYL